MYFMDGCQLPICQFNFSSLCCIKHDFILKFFHNLYSLFEKDQKKQKEAADGPLKKEKTTFGISLFNIFCNRWKHLDSLLCHSRSHQITIGHHKLDTSLKFQRNFYFWFHVCKGERGVVPWTLERPSNLSTLRHGAIMELFRKKEMKAFIRPTVKQVIVLHKLSQFFCNFINTTANRLGLCDPSSPSTKELHGCNLRESCGIIQS